MSKYFNDVMRGLRALNKSQLEEVNNGQPQYRTASKKWEINDEQTT